LHPGRELNPQPLDRKSDAHCSITKGMLQCVSTISAPVWVQLVVVVESYGVRWLVHGVCISDSQNLPNLLETDEPASASVRWLVHGVCISDSKNLPNLLETDEPASASATGSTEASSSVGRHRPLSSMSELSIGGRHLISEVQVWWANCLHNDDR